jgi:hypothetical protein
MTAGRKTTSLSVDWGTPPKYVEAVKDVLGYIALDPCSNQYSIVGASVEYKLPCQDGLIESWDYPTIYVNPPYGIDKSRGTRIRDWFCRCYEAHKVHGSEVLALVPVATNTVHWKKYVFNCATSVCFLFDTRLKFLVAGEEKGKGAPMACAMVYWGQNPELFKNVFSKFGAVLALYGSALN